MDTEKMRRVLAYAIEMPDVLDLPLSTVEVPIWGAYDGWNVYANTLQGSICAVWEPDIRWDQCGMVIEAMREKGWDFQVRETDGERAWAVFWKDDPEIDGHGHASKILLAICQAAYRALGGTERVKMGDFNVDYPPKMALL